MELKIIADMAGLDLIKEDWGKLLQYPCNRGIHQRFDWFCLSCQLFHENDKIYVLVLTDTKNIICAIAPLVVYSGIYRGIKVEKIGFVRNPQNPANDFLFSPGSEYESIRSIVEHLRTFTLWEMIDLQQVYMNSLTGINLRRVLGENGWAFGTKSNRQSPYICIDLDWETFWKTRSQRFKKAMRHKINRAQKNGGMVIEKIPLKSGDAPELEVMGRISRNSWKFMKGTDLASSSANLNFYKQICDLWGPEGYVFAWFLKVDEMPLAFEFHIEYEGTVYPIRADYDENFKSLSPGSLLEYEIMQSIFLNSKHREYHSCGHSYEYLLNWTDKIKDHQNFEIFKLNIKMFILYWFEYRAMVILRKLGFVRLYKLVAG